MITYYSADYIFPISAPKIPGGVVALDWQGVIHGVYTADDERLKGKEIVRYNGVLIPGLVNAHCHLELSHMNGKIPKKTGLPDFLSTVMSQRQEKDEKIQQTMAEADRMMHENGIQAVGDHVNSSVSARIKASSPIHYHTFVEIIGMAEDNVQEKIDYARDIEYYFDQYHSSITPHAPYSCSDALLKCFAKSVSIENIISMHNQESEEENKLFRYGTGGFIDFYKKNTIPYPFIKPRRKSSLQYYAALLPRDNKLILVHNTFTSFKDMAYMARRGHDVYYCLCPKANLYIEGRLPKIRDFSMSKQKIVVGTDSLASNDTLDILEELKVIQQEEVSLSTEVLLRWATLNGAEALGLDSFLGSLDTGKTPGLLLMEGMEGDRLDDKAKVRRIV